MEMLQAGTMSILDLKISLPKANVRLEGDPSR
jgi:hypothetical protein